VAANGVISSNLSHPLGGRVSGKPLLATVAPAADLIAAAKPAVTPLGGVAPPSPGPALASACGTPAEPSDQILGLAIPAPAGLSDRAEPAERTMQAGRIGVPAVAEISGGAGGWPGRRSRGCRCRAALARRALRQPRRRVVGAEPRTPAPSEQRGAGSTRSQSNVVLQITGFQAARSARTLSRCASIAA
jgi:hypothetical protein